MWPLLMQNHLGRQHLSHCHSLLCHQLCPPYLFCARPCKSPGLETLKVKSRAKRRDGKVGTSKFRIMSREQLKERWQRRASTPKHIINFLSREQGELATHSSILAWKIPWTEEPGGLQSMGSQSVRHNWATEHMLVIIPIVHYIPSEHYIPSASSYNLKFVPFDCFHPTTSPLILAFGKHKSDLSLWFFGLFFKDNWPMIVCWGFPRGASGKEPACQCRRLKRHGFDPWVGKIPWRRQWQPTPVSLPGESHGQRRLVGHSPQGHKESDTTEAT